MTRLEVVALAGACAFVGMRPVDAWQQAAGSCRVSERATSAATPLPGVSILVSTPASAFTPGLYTCEISIIDTVTGKFEFPRMLFVVR